VGLQGRDRAIGRDSGIIENPVAAESIRRPSEPPPADGEPTPSPVDVLLIHGVTDDGSALQVVRQRQDRLEAGALRPVQEGRPILGELVRVRPRSEFPLLCDVEVMLPAARRAADVAKAPELESSRRGPAQVATDRYRDNWDVIWKRPSDDSGMPN
jgi:hypothetical protein